MLSKPIPEMGMTEILQSAFTRYLYLSLRGRMGGEGGGGALRVCVIVPELQTMIV